MIEIERIDHFVIPVSDMHAVADFYVRALGMEKVEWGNGRVSLHFGQQKINLQTAGAFDGEHAPNHIVATQDFCLITSTPMEQVVAHLQAEGIKITNGPGTRTGALGPMTSVYFDDPDGNLVEISSYG